MPRLIDADALYERLKADEELARDRVIDTPNSFPNGMLNPAAVRYQAQLTERTRLKEIVYDAPTIEEHKWIPCSERLPKEEEDFLVTDGESMAVGYYRQDAKAWDSADFGWIENREKGYGINKVIAWMPLPEPYAERREE